MKNTISFEIYKSGLSDEDFLLFLKQTSQEHPTIQIEKCDVPFAVIQVATEDEYEKIVEAFKSFVKSKNSS